MARYDRIARIAPPQRDHAYAGWLTLRDLEGRERDGDLGRRSRLRFLAVRLVHRLIDQGTGVDQDSLRRQCDGVREELGQLSSRDPERQRLAELLNAVPALDIGDIVRATLKLAETSRDGEHWSAAEEFYRASVELAEANGLVELGSEGRSGLRELQMRAGRSLDA